MDVNSTASWRIPMAVQIVPCGMLLIGGVFLHESPLWLFRNDRVEDGTKALEGIRHLSRDHECKTDVGQLQRKQLTYICHRLTRRYTNDPRSPYRGKQHCEQIWNWVMGTLPWSALRIITQGNEKPYHFSLLFLCATKHVWSCR